MGNHLDEVEELYSENVSEKGPTPESVGWEDESTQKLRFQKLTEVIEHDGPISVNDLGCGYGALYNYLKDDRKIEIEEYNGYDISEEMVATATEAALGSESVCFNQGSELRTEADYSFASGIFNVKLDNEEREWKDHIYQVLDNLYEHSRYGFAFNLLSTHVDYEEDHLFYGCPAQFVDHCLKEYSRRVTLYHDYGLYEWTLTISLRDD